MFWIGFIIPILWIIGAFIAPTERAQARPQGRPGDINPQRAVLPALEVVAGATELLSIQSEPLGAG